MSTAEAIELTDVLSRVKNWSPESRIVLAGRILETLEGPQRPAAGLPARSVQELIGLGAGDSPHPTMRPSAVGSPSIGWRSTDHEGLARHQCRP